MLILAQGDTIEIEDVRSALPTPGPRATPAVPTDGPLHNLVEDFERAVIRERLRQLGGHMTNTARSLDLERSHLYKKCKQLGIDVREND